MHFNYEYVGKKIIIPLFEKGLIKRNKWKSKESLIFSDRGSIL
jgi:hypothetical protein